MSDLISRQAAIRFIRDKVSLSLFMQRSVDKADKACAKLCEMLDRDLPPAEPEQQWIPISSNPITTGLYLVLCNEFGKNRYRICAYYSEVGKWIENGKNITKSITHWMPLPERWKGEADGRR